MTADLKLPPGWTTPKSLGCQQLCRPDGSIVNDGNGTRAYADETKAAHDAWKRSGLGTHHEYERERGEEPDNKWKRALDRIYDKLWEVEEIQLRMEKENPPTEPPTRDGLDIARLIGTAINACKHDKQPEFDLKFGDEREYTPKEGVEGT